MVGVKGGGSNTSNQINILLNQMLSCIKKAINSHTGEAPLFLGTHGNTKGVVIFCHCVLSVA